MSESKQTLPIGMQIAVIGISGRFPGARNTHEFWNNLCNGVESITFFAKDKLAPWRMQPDLIHRSNFVAAKGVIQDPEYFDADFFGYSHREATVMDPQIRLFHEGVWEALEDAGYDPGGNNSTIGIFAGSSPNVYWQGLSLLSRIDSFSEQFAALSFADKDFMNTNISYKLNLNGPSILVHTACSTSLVAIHLACRALLTGECSMAVAGGISVPVPNPQGYLYQEGMILSPDGHCRPFDAKAAGTVPGEGFGVVVLKSLKRALADGDHIYAVIRGSASNNDGNRKIGFTAPSIDGQTDVIRTAQRMSRVEPESISYIEAHGTGTALGDPIEIEALTAAFHTEQRGTCYIGSVKSNLGHLDAASGVAGFLKTVLALSHRQIPPTLHFTAPNPRIDFANSPFVVATQLLPWEQEHGPLRAGVSSFGIGGTNAHVILEEAPQPVPSAPARPWHLLLLSAKTATALHQMSQQLRQDLEAHPQRALADVAHTLQVGRAAFAHRRVLVCATTEQAIAELAREEMEPPTQTVVSHEHRPQYWLFPGQGAQYPDMGRQLYEHEPVFRETLDRCLALAEEAGAGDLRALLYPEVGKSGQGPSLEETEVAQPLLFSVEYALACMLRQWGFRPQGMLGHSLGEYVAACVAEVFSLPDAMRLVVRRGQLMARAPRGAMVSIERTPAQLQDDLHDGVSLAAVNTPHQCVLSGNLEAIATLEARWQQEGYRFRRLHTSHAFHSALMESVLEDFAHEVRQCTLQPPRLPYLSNVTGTWIQAQEATDPAYWVRQLREGVRFAEGIGHLLADPHAVLLEVGPGRSLSTFARQGQGARREQEVLNLLRHPLEEQSDEAYLLTRLGRLWSIGGQIDWAARAAGEQRQRLALPTYPFERQRFWLEEELEEKIVSKNAFRPELATPVNTGDSQNYFYLPSWERQPSELVTASPRTPLTATYLLFQDEAGVAKEIAKLLTIGGGKVILVEQGTEYTVDDENVFFINPEIGEHYTRLFEDLQSKYGMITTIIYCWGLTKNVVQRENLGHMTSRLQEVGYYGLLALARILAKHPDMPIHLKIITNNAFEVIGTEIVNPAQALLVAPNKVIPLEYKHIHCSNIDIVLTEQCMDGVCNALLVREITTGPTDGIVALRGKYRWTQTFKQIQLDESREPSLRAHSTYLITGGLGAIGLTLAEALATKVQANIVLITKSAFPARDLWDDWLQTHPEEDKTAQKIYRLRDLEKRGVTLMLATTDVANREQMQKVIDMSLARFQTIHGVIHCAGVADGALIQGRTREWEQHILSAKVRGTLILDEVLTEAGCTPDFVLLCSALAATIAPIGQVGYVAANSFLDAFAHYKGSSWLSIGWDTWKDAGMAVNPAGVPQNNGSLASTHYGDILSKQGSYGISSEEGAAIFLRLLSCSSAQILFSTAKLEKRIEENRLLSAFYTSEPSAKAHGKLADVIKAVSDVEQELSKLWQDFLGVATINVSDNWFDMGASSLDIIQLNSIVNTHFGSGVSLSHMFTFSTIQSLAEFIYQKDFHAQVERGQKDREEQQNAGKERLKKRISKIQR